MQILIENLNKSYAGKQALKNINLEIGSGMFGLLGPNGAGKTTFMRILATLIPADSGRIDIDGLSFKEQRKIRKILGYLPQEFGFYPGFTVYKALDYLAVLAGLTDKMKRQKQVEILLRKVNLWEHRKVKTRALSGGMKRRLGIAQALINEPELLIVDEPTAGLDPEERVRFRNLLSDFAVDRTVILSTHIVGDIEFSCERLAILDQGSIIYNGRVGSLLQKAEGYVWEMNVKRDDINAVRNKYRIVSHVSNGEIVKVRVINKEKPEGDANTVVPGIEDAYMGLMGGII